jgi:hypothetical protein
MTTIELGLEPSVTIPHVRQSLSEAALAMAEGEVALSGTA